jgi:hypothetical protein
MTILVNAIGDKKSPRGGGGAGEVIIPWEGSGEIGAIVS